MFFKKNKNVSDSEDLIKVCALLVHAAKIDENYSTEEKNIISTVVYYALKSAAIIEDNRPVYY